MTNTSNSATSRSAITMVHNVIDLCPLVGFTVAALRKVDGDGIYITLENGRNCAIDLLYDGSSLWLTSPYGVDRDGNRIEK